MNYVDNEELYNEICKWKAEIERTGENVRMPDSIGKAILLIANGFTRYFKFVNYTQDWKDAMIADAIEANVKGLINFDEKNFTNPHAYITQSCFRAFINRIQLEKYQQAAKYNFYISAVHDDSDDDLKALVDNDFLQDMMSKVGEFEASQKRKKKPKKEQEYNNLLDQFL